jgi:hypothetical protein
MRFQKLLYPYINKIGFKNYCLKNLITYELNFVIKISDFAIEKVKIKSTESRDN